MDEAPKAPLSQFSGPEADVRSWLSHALAELSSASDWAQLLESIQERAEATGQQAQLAAAYAEVLNGPELEPLPSGARLEVYLQAAWLCGQEEALETVTLQAATLALDIAPADERALALAEPLLLDAGEYSELANRYAVAATSAGTEARAKQLLERAIHMLSPLAAAAPAVVGLNERLQRLAVLRDSDEALLAVAEHAAPAESSAALIKLGERWLAEGRARDGLALLQLSPSKLGSEAALDVLERLCDQAEDGPRLEQTLLRRVELQTSTRGRARALEKLASFQHESSGDKPRAAATLLAVAALYADSAEPDEAERVYERLLDLLPDHAVAAESLVTLRARSGNFAGVADAFGVVLRSSEDNRHASELLLAIVDDAERAGAADEFAELADNVQWRLSGEDRELSQRLLRASARLFASATRHDEAAELYRRLIADRPTSEDIDHYQVLIDSNPGSEWRRNQQRWLFEWQENHSSDRPTILLSWARFEEHELGDPEAAMNVLARAAELAPDRAEVWENLTRLRLLDGDGGGGLLAAGELRRLGRDVDGSLLGLLLEQEPGTRWALDRVKLTLSAEQRWPELFELYERAVAATANERERAELLDEAAIAARDVAQDRARALAYWERYTELVPGDARVDLSLERLYDQTGEKAGLIRHLERRRERSEAAAQPALDRRIAELCLETGDLQRALAAVELLRESAVEQSDLLLEALFARGLQLAPAEPGALGPGRRAAVLLRERYAETEQPEQAVRVLRVELTLELDAKERRELLGELGRLCERELGDLDGACQAERELFLLTLGERERKRLEKLSKKLGRWRELCTTYTQAALVHRELDERRGLLSRAADVARERLEDSGLALSLYRQLFEQEPARASDIFGELCARGEVNEAFEALCQLFEQHGRYPELAEALEQALQRRPGADLHARLARVQEQQLGNPRAAIATHLRGNDSRAAAQVFLRQPSVFADQAETPLELARRLANAGEPGGALDVLRHQLAQYEGRYPSERKLVHLEVVKVLLESGDAATAQDELLETAKRYPADAEVQRTCGAAAAARQDWDKAEQCYRSLLLLLHGSGATATDTCRASVYVDLATIKEQRRQSSEAAELLESAFEAALGNVRELTALAQSLVSHGKAQAAERAIGQLLDLAQDLATAARALSGVARLRSGGHEPSTELLERASKAAAAAAEHWQELDDPDERSSLLAACVSLLPLEPARQLLGEAGEQLKPADRRQALLALSQRLLEVSGAEAEGEALARLDELVQDPEAPSRAWQLLLRARLRGQDADGALGCYDRLARAGIATDVALLSDLRKLLLSAGNWQRAAELLRLEAEREKQTSKRAALLVEAAQLLLDARQLAPALQLARDARELDPASAEAVLLLAKLALGRGEREQALTLLSEHAAVKERRRGKPLAQVLRLAADLRLERDELAEALPLLMEAHQLDKTDLDTALLLGLLAVDLDRLETAASALRVLIAQRELGTRADAASHSLNLAQGYFQLARIEHHHGKKTNAKRMALRAVEENPQLLAAQRLLGELGHA